MNPLVSIITPTYNHECFIGPCIESVLVQTYDNWEMIVVDDGSTDQTWDLVQNYVARDRRIRAFTQANKGIWRLAETYNFALEQSKGELIAVLEGDDMWLPSKLATQVPVHQREGYSISFGQTRFIDASGAFLNGVYPDPKELPFLNKAGPGDLFLHLLRGEYGLPAATVVISRRSLIERGGFQQPHYLPLVDYPTWLLIGAANDGFGFIREVLSSWRQYSTQTTWLLARDIARGMYRLALEFAEREQLDLDIPANDLSQYLLSQGRKDFLADASYRAAALAFETGKQRAWSYCVEIAQLGNYRLFIQCLTMFAWKLARRVAKSIRQSTSTTASSGEPI